MEIREISQDLDGSDLRVGVVVASFNEFITKPLLEGALGRLAELKVASVDVVWVPGALELAPLAGHLAKRADAVIGIGAVIEGETDHYAYVAGQSAAGLTRVAIDKRNPGRQCGVDRSATSNTHRIAASRARRTRVSRQRKQR